MSDEANGVKTFLIYGAYERVNLAALVQYLNDSVDILSLWNHLPLLYCVKTRMELPTLRYKLTPFFSNSLFVVIEIDRNKVDGIMPKAAWDWFSTPAPLHKSATSLSQLFGLISPPPSR